MQSSTPIQNNKIMATYFGEIVSSSSRAIDDEDDDELDGDNSEHSITCVRWSPLVRAEVLNEPDKKLPCQNLIVAIGPAASGFAQAYLVTEDFYIVGAIFSGMNEEDFNTFEQTSPSDKTCYIYRSRRVPDMFLCLCKTDVDPEQAYSWTDQLFSSISTSRGDIYVSVLCTYMTSEYKSDIPTSDMQPPFLRALRTTKFPGTPLCPYLEQPNLVSGLPAQLLTYCQMLDTKAVLYICYTDSVYLDHASMKVFYPLLKSTPIKDVIRENPKADQELNHIVDLYTSRDSLYI